MRTGVGRWARLTAAWIFIGSTALAGNPEFSFEFFPGFVDASPMTLADVDGDARLDAVSVGINPLRIQSQRGDGFGRFGSVVTTVVPTFFIAVAGGDFDADGDDDLALLENSTSKVHIWRSLGDGTFAAWTTLGNATSTASLLRCADVNADGRDDVIATSNGLRVFTPTSSGSFLMGPAITNGGASIKSYVLLDVDGNGLLDAATVDGQTNLRINTNLGLFGFSVTATIPVPAPANELLLTDVDGDSIDDFAIVGTVTTPSKSCSVAIAPGLGNGSFGSGTTVIPSVAQGLGARLLDIDDDGDRDVVMTIESPLSGSAKFVSLRDASGAYGSLIPLVNPPNSGLTTHLPANFSVLDLDGDALDDVVTGVAGFGIYVARGAGASTFALPPVAQFGSSTSALAVTSDLNADSHADLLVAFDGRSDAWFGKGDGSFVGPAPTLNAKISVQTAIADFDVDGDLDIASTTPQKPIPIVLGVGNGTFISGVDANPATNVQRLAIGDFDGNGADDLIGYGQSSATSNVLLNDGSAHFTQHATLVHPGGALPYRVVIADLDLDGDLDAAMPTKSQNQMLVWHGDGLGAFPTTSTHNLGVGSTDDLCAADFDLDGDTDLAGWKSFTSTVVPVEQTGPGGLVDHAAVLLGPLPEFATPVIRADDFDGDGILDIGVPRGANLVIDFVVSKTPWNFVVRRLPTTIPAKQFGIADFDENGTNDVVVFGSPSTAFTPDTAVLLAECPSRVARLESGCPGSASLVPRLRVTGCVEFGATLETTIDRGLGGALGLMLVSASESPAFALGVPCALRVGPIGAPPIAFMLGGTGAGAGSLAFPTVLPSAYPAMDLFAQVVFVDSGAPGGLSASNAVQVRLE